MRPNELRSAGAQRHFEPEAIARHHLTPELRVVDAAQIGTARRTAVRRLHEQQRGDLRERLDDQDPGHQRRARKVTLEVVLAHADVLDGDEPLPWLVLHHGVHEGRGEPIAEPIDCVGDAEGHGGVVYQLPRHQPSALSFSRNRREAEPEADS